MISEALRTGDGVRVRPDASSRYAGRMGLVADVVDDQTVRVRFSAVRTYVFSRSELTKVVNTTRR